MSNSTMQPPTAGHTAGKHELPEAARQKISNVKAIPAMPMILMPLLELLQKPTDQVPIDEVVRLVSYDKTIAAQCLRIAGSPLFGLSRAPETIRSAVISMGITRLKDVVLTFSLGQILPAEKFIIDPGVFWRHSLGCALVCRKFCELTGALSPEKAYLAGLLHDLGIIVNCMVFPEESARAIERGQADQIPLHEAERAVMGFSHCETGRVLGEAWRLPDEMREVIACHHDLDMSKQAAPLVAVVYLSDMLCRMRDMGYGYYESRRVDFMDNPAWAILAESDAKIGKIDLERFTFEMDEAAADVAVLVDNVFAGKPAQS
jgi:HD-like signal output (HDOD) protein